MRSQFWKLYTLDQLDSQEWEALCDRCNLCCHHRVKDTQGQLHYEGGCCSLLDHQRGCTDYLNRSLRVPQCQPLTLERLEDPSWLPPSCAYRLRAEGRDLYPWHPLNMNITWINSGD